MNMTRIEFIVFVLTCSQLITGVHLAKVSDAPKLVGLLDELSNPEGTNATITCSIGSGNLQGLTYDWYKNDQRITASSGDGGTKKIRIDNPGDNYVSILRVYNLDPSDAGVYSCIAKNRFGQDKISTKLDVKVQLKWTQQPPEELTVSAGKSIFVPCLAHGNPMPQVHWYKINDDELGLAAPETRASLGSEFRYSSIEPQQGGMYECRASNGAEEDLVTRLKLNVLGE